MSERTIAVYAREIRPLLPRTAFAPAFSRLGWLPAHLVCISLLTTALGLHWVPWLLAPFLSLLIGMSFAGLTFLGHETLHGAVVRGAMPQRVVGWFGFLPFAVSPRLWLAWHNRVHHGNTQIAGRDPDAYPTLHEYQASRAIRAATEIAPGSKRLRGFLTPLIGFSVQSAHMLVVARQRGYLSSKQHAWAIAESLLAIAVWVALALLIGPLPFLFAFGLPLLVANAIVMGFILTNHSLSQLTFVNDPLVNSLTVTTSRLVSWLTLGFGFHVEHHLFPAMSARHAPEVQAVLQARWPERYQSMPLLQATAALHLSPRVYKDSTTLFDPRSGQEWPALTPQPRPAAAGPTLSPPRSARAPQPPSAVRLAETS